MTLALYPSRWLSQPLAREELQQQAIDLGGVLVRGPVAGPGNPVHVERAHGLADLANQQICGPERGIVALTPEQPDPTAELREVAQERPAAAHLAAVEAGPADARGLDVHRVLGDAILLAKHVDEQVVAADLPEERL